MQSKIIVILTFLILPNFLIAATLYGKVMDSKGQIIPFASIKIAKLKIGVNSNLKGFYSIQLTKGTYDVICSSIGYKTAAELIQCVQSSLAFAYNPDHPSDKSSRVLKRPSADQINH